MKTVDVCLSPELIHHYDLAHKIIVVVDILRATSCITTGLASGIISITPFESLDECVAMKSKGYLIAGERDGQKVDGFDIGNSPFSYMESKFDGEKIAVTTTNGTLAIEKSKDANLIVIGSFLNITAIASFISGLPDDVIVFCAGWKGHVCIEDALFAGALVDKLIDYEYVDDSVYMARSLYIQHKNDLLTFVQKAGHAKRLRKFNVIKDIEFCLTLDKYEVVPIVKDGVIIPA